LAGPSAIATFAYKALQGEDKIGTMLPCNVAVQQADPSAGTCRHEPHCHAARCDAASLHR
jgi:hypothetical protein